MIYKLSNQRYEEIKDEVTLLMEEHGVRCIPVSGFELATHMGVTLIPYSSLTPEKRAASMLISMDGFLTVEGIGAETIYYNDGIGYERINWTFLHEIGHLVLGHLEHDDEAEAEANFFAKYAAAPPVLVHKIKPQSPNEIAKVFGLSFEAACHAFDYYQKWLRYRPSRYTGYELRLLRLFDAA